ncbi:hypothetical protein KPK_3070 [Klebsiella variicola]|uniref:Uncharacterized protein n=1 Tax=Klebsiella variicola (strain 342) TaxID=507522 RepID=B5XRS2_KLEV3|nr:hypothetical protein KPK_3070 [Klebsiella variicola]
MIIEQKQIIDQLNKNISLMHSQGKQNYFISNDNECFTAKYKA